MVVGTEGQDIGNIYEPFSANPSYLYSIAHCFNGWSEVRNYLSDISSHKNDEFCQSEPSLV